MLVSNVDWDDYVGRVALGKILSGSVKKGDTVWRLRKGGQKTRATVTKVFEYSKLGTRDADVGQAGNIVGVAGFEDADIGETLAGDAGAEPLPFLEIDPPTVRMQFAVNDGPFAGKDGRKVTSRAIWDRLQREVKTNISIEVAESDEAGVFNVNARGAMQISVLVETMRREGFEVLVSRPVVITRQVDGVEMEPFETLYLELPEGSTGGVIQALANRKGTMETMEPRGAMTCLEATIPTRGLIGFEFELMNLTSGHGVMSHLFKEYRPPAGKIRSRKNGVPRLHVHRAGHGLLPGGPGESGASSSSAPPKRFTKVRSSARTPAKATSPSTPPRPRTSPTHRSATKTIDDRPQAPAQDEPRAGHRIHRARRIRRGHHRQPHPVEKEDLVSPRTQEAGQEGRVRRSAGVVAVPNDTALSGFSPGKLGRRSP